MSVQTISVIFAVLTLLYISMYIWNNNVLKKTIDRNDRSYSKLYKDYQELGIYNTKFLHQYETMTEELIGMNQELVVLRKDKESLELEVKKLKEGKNMPKCNPQPKTKTNFKSKPNPKPKSKK